MRMIGRRRKERRDECGRGREEAKYGRRCRKGRTERTKEIKKEEMR